LLQPGTVVYLEVQFRQRARNKYLIILEWDDPISFLIINSEVHPLFGHGEWGNCYVDIDAATHAFLTRDSHIDCNEAIPISLAEFNLELTSNPGIVVGQISDEVRTNIIEAIKGTPGLTPDEKTRIIERFTCE